MATIGDDIVCTNKGSMFYTQRGTIVGFPYGDTTLFPERNGGVSVWFHRMGAARELEYGWKVVKDGH